MVTFPYHNKSIIALVFLILTALFSGSVYASVQEASTAGSLCGNGVINQGEQCDTGGSRGACPATCSTSCATNSCGGGGGGGGGGNISSPVVTSVVFSGRAYPKSIITLLKDAQIAATSIAGADANFSITLSGLSGGNYIFSVYSEDNKGNRSSLLTFPVSVTSNVTTNVSGIFIAPTIAVDKSEVKRGDNIAIFGQSTPQSDIVISVNSDEEFFGKTISDKDGIYLYNFDSSIIDYGDHSTKSKASIGNQLISSWSYLISFKVGTKNVFAQPTKCPAKADLNNDCRVNLVDFSILLFSWGIPKNLAADLNGDGKVNLTDFSIMLYYWTG